MQKLSGKDLVKRIDTLLDQRQQTRKALSMEFSIPQQTVSNWKVNNVIPSGEILFHIAQYFGVSMEWLLTGHERETEPVDADALALARDIAAMPPVVKESLISQIEIFKRSSLAESPTETVEPSGTALTGTA